METLLEGRVLSVVTFVPLATALGLVATSLVSRLVLGSPGLPGVVWRVIAVAATGATLLIAVLGLWRGFDPEQLGFQLIEHVPWLPEYGVNYFVAVDGISLCLALLTTLLFPVVLVGTWNQVDRMSRSFVFFMLTLETGMLGTFFALNLLQFYLFWELMLIPMYFIIGMWGGSRRIHATTKFIVFTMLGSLLMLVAILVLYRMNYGNLDLVTFGASESTGLLEMAIPVGGQYVEWWQTQRWLFGAFALAFAIKVPVFPLHTWLPDAHVEAPTAGSVLLAAIMLKMGAYGFLRFALPLFPNAATDAAPLFFALGLTGIVYGSLVAMVQKDLKKLIAYSSIAHLGFVIIGIFALNEHGLTGAVMQMLSHGLATGALFLLVGVIYERRHTHDITAFGGLAKPMPVYAAIFGICVMSSIGLPALAGFVGEFLILLGSFQANRWVGVIATSGVVLSAAYLLSMYRRVLLGPVENPENRGLIDLSWRERLAFLALVIPLFWIGIHPNPILRRIEPAVLELQKLMDDRHLPDPLLQRTPPPPRKPFKFEPGGQAI